LTKNLKLKIKNTQLAKALNLDGVKSKLKKKGEAEKSKDGKPKVTKSKAKKTVAKDKEKKVDAVVEEKKEPVVQRRAKKKSSFVVEEGEHIEDLEADDIEVEEVSVEESDAAVEEPNLVEEKEETTEKAEDAAVKTEDAAVKTEDAAVKTEDAAVKTEDAAVKTEDAAVKTEEPVKKKEEKPAPRKVGVLVKRAPKKVVEVAATPAKEPAKEKKTEEKKADDSTEDPFNKKGKDKEKAQKREVKRSKPLRQEVHSFDARDKKGLRPSEEGQWRRRRHKRSYAKKAEIITIRPSALHVRVPISIKQLASDMKLKASQLVAKLFMQGIIVTLNDILDDETTIQLLGHEFDCEITIDTSEEEKIRITDKTVLEEIAEVDASKLEHRPPVIAFMGHVDHGKTSLIDSIRKTNRASGEAGAITQHIGAFQHVSDKGIVTILDTPGHEAFSAMRARGANVTDAVILVVGGDEGIRQQTVEAIDHAKAAGVVIIVAINKCDKPNFDAETVYRQLAEHELLPEAWGGSTITVNCSATTGQGIEELMEMVLLQTEILELNANPEARARGIILESEMHKGFGSVATVIIQNGTLKKGEAVVLGNYWGRVKTIRDGNGSEVELAGPSMPVEITGLSGLPKAGDEFIVIETEREAREIAEARSEEGWQKSLVAKKKISLENLLLDAAGSQKKVLNLILRADVQGSLEALKVAIMKIESDKAEPNILLAGVGEVSESDIQLAAASKAVIIGFHSDVESHADALIKELEVKVFQFDVIYHAIDHAKKLMTGLLDKIEKENIMGTVEVKAIFKVSHTGAIAGCFVSDGYINRNHFVKVQRAGETIWTGKIASLKREKDDVKEVKSGFECGVLLEGYNDIIVDDVLVSYEIMHLEQEL
jgi:translation initiation factor IF-2